MPVFRTAACSARTVRAACPLFQDSTIHPFHAAPPPSLSIRVLRALPGRAGPGLAALRPARDAAVVPRPALVAGDRRLHGRAHRRHRRRAVHPGPRLPLPALVLWRCSSRWPGDVAGSTAAGCARTSRWRRADQRPAAPRLRALQPVGPPPRRAPTVRRSSAGGRCSRWPARDVGLPVGDHAAELPCCRRPSRRGLLGGHADARPGALPRHRHAGVLGRVRLRAPPVLPLRLRGRAVPEPGVDGQSEGHGGRVRPRPRARLPRLPHAGLALGQRLRPQLPDAPASARHQADDVLVRAVRIAWTPARPRRPGSRRGRCWRAASASTRCARRCASAAPRPRPPRLHRLRRPHPPTRRADMEEMGRSPVAPLHHPRRRQRGRSPRGRRGRAERNAPCHRADVPRRGGAAAVRLAEAGVRAWAARATGCSAWPAPARRCGARAWSPRCRRCRRGLVLVERSLNRALYLGRLAALAAALQETPTTGDWIEDNLRASRRALVRFPGLQSRLQFAGGAAGRAGRRASA